MLHAYCMFRLEDAHVRSDEDDEMLVGVQLSVELVSAAVSFYKYIV